ncbi:Beta-arrestin-1 [Fasciola hepatica]|uniref:Beta-arrestin-1 n=1 Tax=Fasciola hepatica TaxID=6192 RepID=A0A4E0R679_FASHE|nr:Beta-arrestin-1 [Fasciola hepatica]
MRNLFVSRSTLFPSSPSICGVSAFSEGFPICPSQTGWCKVYRLCPLLIHNRDKIGIAMDGDLKHEDTNLASSTISPPHSGPRIPVGILVQYKVKVRLILGFSISDVCLELPFILTHPNPEENRLNDREPEVDEVFSLSMPADLTAPMGLPVAPMQLTQQPPRTPNSLPSNTRPHSSSPTNRLHEQPSNVDPVAVIGNMVNGDQHRNPVEETTIPSQKHLVLHRHTNSAVAAPGRAHTIAGNGSVCTSDQFPLRTLIHETVDNGGNVQIINTINKSGISVHTDTHYAVDHSTRSVSMFQANHSPALFSSVGHAVTLPLVAGQSSIISAQYIPSNDVFPFMMNSTDCGVLTSVGGLNSGAGGSLTHGPAPRPPTRHRFQSAAASDGTGITAGSLMYSSFKSERHPSLAGTQSTASEDDLMFEDFARLRLQSVTGSRKAQPSVF